MPTAQETTMRLDAPGVDPRLVLGPLGMMRSDPTIRSGRHEFLRATHTPEGPATIRIAWGEVAGVVTVRTSGDGAAWLTAGAGRLIGVDDDATSFDPVSPTVRLLQSRFAGDRVGATGTVWHDLCWTITQQRVSRRDAAAQWTRLVRAFGEPCPDHDGVYLPPVPERLARAATWSLRSMGIDERRASALIAAARVAPRLHSLAVMPFDEAAAALRSLPGVGPWTLGCLSAFTWGDPDTVITGDSGIPSLVASALSGERRADDARMLELLEPFRPHRYRVLRLLLAARTGRQVV